MTVTAIFFSFFSQNFMAEEIVSDNSELLRDSMEVISEYSNTYPDKYAEICDIVQTLLDNDSYIAEYSYSSKSAVETMKRTLDDAFSSDDSNDVAVPYGADYHGMFYADYTVPVIKQISDIYCGAAAVLQTAIGNGDLANTASNKSASFQQNEADMMEIDIRGKAQAFKVEERLNYHNKSTAYTHVGNTIYTSRSTLINNMTTCFTKRRCPIVCFEDTAGLGYYNGASYGHWVTVSAIDDIRKTITLVDPHFNSTYGGVHTVTYDKFFDALGVNDGWIIY